MFKIGHGYDLHKLVEGRPLILCGVKIPFNKGEYGHSDADVATHALIDALLGAAGLGDIGTHFPDTDCKYKNISSLILLNKVVKMLENNKLQIGNIDITIILQAPKILKYKNQMKCNLSPILKIPKENINIKATTQEGLGSNGLGLSISSFCSCLLSLLIYKH